MNATTMRMAVALLPMLAIACGSATSDSAPDEESDLLNDAEVMQELGARPSYNTRSVAIRGEYKTNEYCAGGFDVCERILVTRVGNQTKIQLGYWDGYPVRVWSSRGVVLFSAGQIHDDCDDPGCGNMISISGVIYPVRKGNAWVPQIKANYLAEFPYPEEPDAPEGEVRTTVHMKKQ